MSKTLDLTRQLVAIPSWVGAGCNEIATLVFDLDGTLYSLLNKACEISGYCGSLLEKIVQTNARRLVVKLKLCDLNGVDTLMKEASLDPIGISQYLYNNFGITRDDYFSEVWNINPEKVILFDSRLKALLLNLKEKNRLILLTSAPAVWQKNIFKYLKLADIFAEIYTGDTFKTKSEIFEKLAKEYPPSQLMSIGDQYKTDIAPAQIYGINTLLVKEPKDIVQLLGDKL